MKKVMKMLAACLLAVFVSASFAGCGGDTVPSETGEGEAYKIWGAPATVKIMREATDYEDKRAAEINFTAVLDEYESKQLIIEGVTKDVSYYLHTADLSDGKGNEIGKENVKVYNEYYTFLPSGTAPPYSRGYYPDALIPQEYAEKAGEMRVKAGELGALWVDFKIPADTVPGIYTGNFTLTVDGEENNIPVWIEVLDYRLPEVSHFDSLYTTWFGNVAQGEMDWSYEMRVKYYEFMLDYRINAALLPIENFSPEEHAEVAKKYAADDRVKIYQIPQARYMGYNDAQIIYNIPSMIEFVDELCKETTPELNLLEKAVLYPADEPDGTGWVDIAVSHINEIKASLAALADKIEADTTGVYDGLKSYDGWREKYVEGIRIVVTFKPAQTEALRAITDVWSPNFGGFTTPNEADAIMSLAEQNDAAVWWYGCMAPSHPWPSYQFDDDPLNLRLVNWMGQSYGVTGQLFWGLESAANVYEEPHFKFDRSDTSVFNAVPGDGFLVYPGALYGHDGPFPSIRLMATRDGIEEYDLLMDLQDAYEKLGEKYDITLDAQATVASIYAHMHNGIYPSTDYVAFEDVRMTLLNTLFEVAQPHGFLIQNTTIFEGEATVTMYADAEHYKLILPDGSELLPVSGNRFELKLSTEGGATLNLTIQSKTDENETYTISKFISGEIRMINNFDDASVLSGIQLSGDTSLHKATAELTQQAGECFAGSGLKVSVPSNYDGSDFEDLVFTPYLKVTSSVFEEEIDFNRVSTLKVDVYNLSGREISMKIKFTSGDAASPVMTDLVLVPGHNQITVSLAEMTWSKRGEIDGILFEGVNARVPDETGQWVPFVYQFAIDNMFVEY